MRRSFNFLPAAAGIALFAAALQACSSNNTTSVPAPKTTPLALLVPGSTASYAGTESIAIVYASPGPSQSNSSASYTTAESDAVSATTGSAPAPYEIARSITYTLSGSSKPTAGIQPQSRTIDDFENYTTASSGAQAVYLYQSIASLKGIDVKSGGAYSSTSTTTYTPNTELVAYPLTSGGAWSATETRSVASQTSDATTSGSRTSNTTTAYNADDSFTETGMLTNGDTANRVENSNGTATISDTGPKPLNETIGLPITTCSSGSGTAYYIPVTINSSNYCAADWYPGGVAPPAPLGSAAYSVVGATTLPSSCTPTVTFSGVSEYDQNSSVVNVIGGTVDTTTTRTFDSNGLTVCQLSTATSNSYGTKTGLLVSTNTTTTAAWLTGYTSPTSAQRSSK